MNTYPNILTPPMDSPASMLMSPDSGCSSPPYLIPQNYTSYGISYNTSPIHSLGPYLKILEQPVDRFRFRYKSEMSGTHGSLNGKGTDRTRKQTFPCVELVNYQKPAVIRCTLYQYGKEDMVHSRQLHAHRLVKKQGTEEIDDPHNIEVNPETGFIANFHSMGIIHTARKFIVPELIRKNTILKHEEIARTEHKFRSLTKKEELEIKTLAEKESKCINLNVVCLRFDAFEVINNIYYPICPPVYSHGINNLKSALTGDLRIVRMDHCSSSCKGGREIFILVEKVTKKNIKIRFFELDDEDNEIWSNYGQFNDLDVHHQYAIVFKTPPYKRMDIKERVKVYIELERPSNGARSEPRDFWYTPCENMFGMKRPRCDSDEYTNSQFFMDDLPATISTISQNYETQIVNNPTTNAIVNNDDLDAALRQNNLDSTELDHLCNSLLGTVSHKEFFTEKCSPSNVLGNFILQMDASEERVNKKNDVTSNSRLSTKSTATKQQNIIGRVKTEINSFIKTNPTKERMTIMLKNLVTGENYITSSGNNVLHLLANQTNSENSFTDYFLQLLSKYEQSSLLDVQNAEGKTPLHIAVEIGNAPLVQSLIDLKVNISLPDQQGNTALQIAVIKHIPLAILKLLFHPSDNFPEYIDHFNYNGKTALHLAITTNNMIAAKTLVQKHADVNLNEKELGYTSLHLAVIGQNLNMLKFLLETTDIICDSTDFRGCTALKVAKVLTNSDQPVTEEIYNILEKFMMKNGTFNEALLKDDVDPSDEEVEELTIQLDNSSLCDNNMVVNFTENCLNALSDLLDESGTWKNLAELLDYGHLLKTDIFKSVERPTKSLLKFAIGNGDTVKQIRDILNSLDETKAVEVIDSMVHTK